MEVFIITCIRFESCGWRDLESEQHNAFHRERVVHGQARRVMSKAFFFSWCHMKAGTRCTDTECCTRVDSPTPTPHVLSTSHATPPTLPYPPPHHPTLPTLPSHSRHPIWGLMFPGKYHIDFFIEANTAMGNIYLSLCWYR